MARGKDFEDGFERPLVNGCENRYVRDATCAGV